MNTYQALHSPFDVGTHKANFVNYLEVVILPDGTVEYAVPSHQMKLERILADKLRMSVEDASSLCPYDMAFDYLGWLIRQTGCLSVWIDFCMGRPNEAQLETLKMLRREGLYKGEVYGWII